MPVYKASKICLLVIGTNDTKQPTPLPVYRDNMRQIIMSIKANGMKPIVGTLPPLTFSPSYASNRNYTKKYSKGIDNWTSTELKNLLIALLLF